MELGSINNRIIGIVKTVVFTGGHHTSSLVVAQALQAKGWHIVWFGHRHSMWGDRADSAEYREVTTTGILFYDLKAGKFHRTYHPLKLIRIPLGFLQAFWWLIKIHPVGIVSFGGYLAVPTVIIGWILGIPSITHEQTSVAGWANRAIVPFVRKIAVSWPSSLNLYPKHKVILTGLPLRPEILKIKQRMTMNDHESQRMTIYITGGKQGSRIINEVIFSVLPQLSKKYTIIHQTGSADYKRALSYHYPAYSVFDFDSQKATAALKAADLVISRAGAHIVYELGYLGKKSILIPNTWFSYPEQESNAAILAHQKLAIILPQSSLTANSLLDSISQAANLSGLPMDLPSDATRLIIQLIESEFV